MKKILLTLLLVVLTFSGYKIWNKYVNYNFGAITEGKVYKSAAIAPNKIAQFLDKKNIKTVIDLRHTGDTVSSIAQERKIVEAIDGKQYFSIKSPQVPTKENLKEFYKILDNKDNYPVLIHCYHGLGRTMLYSALYKIEYENYSNEDARAITRFVTDLPPLYNSSFSKNSKKGDYLINYTPRNKKEEK